MIGHDRLKEHLDLVSNTIGNEDLPAELRAGLKASLLGLLSDQSSLSHPGIAGLIRDVCTTCDLSISGLVKLAGSSAFGSAKLRTTLAHRVKRVTVKPFMDMNTMIEERLQQCCVHVGTKSEADRNQCAPFCAVQAWPQLGRQKLSEAAGREAHTVPISLRPVEMARP